MSQQDDDGPIGHARSDSYRQATAPPPPSPERPSRAGLSLPTNVSSMPFEEWNATLNKALAVLDIGLGENIPGTSETQSMQTSMFAAATMIRLFEFDKEPIGLSWKNLTISVPMIKHAEIETTASTFTNTVSGVFDNFKPKEKQEMKVMVEGLNGSVSPGELVLIIGPPGSGCSTLMKVLAGQFDPKQNIVTGEIRYNGEHSDDNKPPKRVRAQVGFCYEGDIHIPELTVQQTLNFVGNHRVPPYINEGKDQDFRRTSRWKETRKTIIKLQNYLVTSFLGINHVKDTVVGDELLRGISGGQRKRVTIGEVLCQFPSLSFYDGYTKGLDAATALSIVKIMKSLSDNFRGFTFICSQYQASPEAFEMYDKVCVLQKDELGGASRCIYFGPSDRNACAAYFTSIGLPKPNLWSWPDFLGTIGIPVGRRRVSRGSTASLPQSAAEFATLFDRSDMGKALVDSIDAREHTPKIPYEQSAGAAKIQARPIFHSFLGQLNICVAREATLMKGRKAVYIQRVVQMCMMALINGFLWFQLDDSADDNFKRQTLMSMVAQHSALGAFVSIPIMLMDRAVMQKHVRNHLFEPAAFFLSKAITDFPVVVVETLLYSILTVFICNFRSDGDAFAHFYINFLILTVASSNCVRAVCCLGRSIFGAYLISFLIVVTLNLLNGFVLPLEETGWWFRWICYISPFQWGFVATALNEFGGQTYTAGGNITVDGDVYLKEVMSVSYDVNFKWPATLINIALSAVMLLIGSLIVTFVRFDRDHTTLRFSEPKDHEAERAKFGGKLREITRKGMKKVRERMTQSIDIFRGSHGGRGTRSTVGSASADGGLAPIPSDAVVVDVEEPKTEDFQAQGAYFTFSDVSYTVDVPKSDKCPDGKLQLLDKVNGYATPGMMIALMGTSGAGKTTLLDVLARRKTAGHIEGDIRVNGDPQDEKFSRMCGYVEQTDNHVTRTTVREAFYFAARLRRSYGETPAQLDQVVEDVIEELALGTVADAMIGSAESGVGISLEALKRVTIGVELVADPSVLFMDEPTSGLDTAGALTVATVARNIADSGRTVICTIHQPSRMVFEQFDTLLLLQRGGRTVYFGDIGEDSRILTNYFQMGGAPPCSDDENPADYMLNCVSPANSEPMHDWTAKVWDVSTNKVKLHESLENGAKALLPDDIKPIHYDSITAASPLTQFVQLVRRQSLAHWRDPSTTIGILVAALFPALLTSFMFINRTGLDQEGARFTQTGLFVAVAITPIFMILLSLPSAYEDRACFYRETSSGIYKKYLYAVSVQLCILPYLFVASLVNAVIVYFALDFDSDRFAYYFLMFEIFIFTAWMQGITIGALTPNMVVGTSAVVVPLSFSQLFCGFLVNYEDIGWWFRWIYYVNPIGLTYSLSGSFQNIFEGRVFEGHQPGNPFSIATGEQVLDGFGWNSDQWLGKWANLGMVGVFLFVWLICGQLALVFIRHGSR
eukprot:m.109810 g.109810  ORF g.109810 m.109810 type:complete len:1457 (+) comp14014_c0_seq3:106-4476(+)